MLKKLLLVLIGCVALAFGILTAQLFKDKPTNPLAHSVGGEFQMIDHNGLVRSTEEFNGKIKLYYFGYTYCPDACPMALGQITQVMNSLTAEQQDQIQPIFVSVDGERDTSEVLKNYLKPFNDKIIALTGDSSSAEQLFHIYSKKVDLGRDDGFYMVDHTTSIFIIGKDNSYITRVSHNQSAKDLFDAINPYLN